MFFIYVLQDEKGRLYKGATSDINRRIKEHSMGKTKTTRSMINPKLVYQEIFLTWAEARKREKYFKTAAGRRFLKTKLRA